MKSHCTICHVCILHFRIVFAGIFCLQTSGLILQNKSHPDSNKSHPGYHQATGLAARPYSFMGNIPLHANGRLRRCSELMVLYYVLSFILGQCFNLHLVTMMQNGQITLTATILTWIQSSMGLISVIASLIAGCHLYSKHRGNMRKLGLALVLVFIAWLICSNLLPVAVFYLADNTQQTAFTCVNIISMITTTSAYIYAYYMMYRAIND